MGRLGGDLLPGTGARGNRRTVAVLALWVTAVIAGEVLLWRYQLTPGAAAAAAPQAWPAGAGIPHQPDRHLLVMIAHPHCVCTRASLSELERLAARFQALPQPPALYLSLIVPAGEDASWIEGPVLSDARAVPGLQVVLDPGARFATELGSTTSGHVLVYGPDRSLLFSGGITAARGHEGDSNGQDAIFAAVYGRRPASPDAPVFGCGLHDPPAASRT
jgi:hypothetical protein